MAGSEGAQPLAVYAPHRQGLNDGFSGFRAAAEMSWALSRADYAYLLIEYEALLRCLFASCRATGLCLYNATRMPLAVLDGALHTHPIVRCGAEYAANAMYNPSAGLSPKWGAWSDAPLRYVRPLNLNDEERAEFVGAVVQLTRAIQQVLALTERLLGMSGGRAWVLRAGTGRRFAPKSLCGGSKWMRSPYVASLTVKRPDRAQ